MAVAAGHIESAHVTRRGMAGWTDHLLMHKIIEGNWTFVTRNSNDFRPQPGSSSHAPCHVGQQLHAGLVCPNLPMGSRCPDQMAHFDAALNHVGNPGDLVNQVLEVDADLTNADQVILKIYNFPKDDSPDQAVDQNSQLEHFALELNDIRHDARSACTRPGRTCRRGFRPCGTRPRR